MCILVVGGDRYLGWPTALHLSAAGHDIGVADDLARRGCDRQRCAASLLPPVPLEHRPV